jgi:hypothetical protein
MNYIKQSFGYAKYIVISILVFMITIPAMGQISNSESSDPQYNFRGFIQQQFVEDATADSPTRFAIHRARLGFNGNVTDRIDVSLTGGFVEPPQGTPRLLHAYMDYNVNSGLTIRAGQFLIPFGIEGNEVIPLNPAIERSNVVRRLNTFSLLSDVGIMVLGERSGFNYSIALVNGAGANQTEQINPKDVVGRAGVSLMNELEVGISGHLGHYQPENSQEDIQRRYRAGADIEYTGSRLFFRGEYQFRRDERSAVQNVDMHGAYLLAGYRFSNRTEVISRYEVLNPNRSEDNDRLEIVTLGLNYYFAGRTRLSVNYEIRDDELNPQISNMLTIQMQVVL